MRKSLNFETKKLYTTLTLKWCKNFFGQNELKRTKLSVKYTNIKRIIRGQMVFGNYCFYRNKITIYLSANETIYDIVSTVIHEYTHYLQSRNRYKIYQNHYYYSTNPYEREARKNEEKYTDLCMKEIKKLIR